MKVIAYEMGYYAKRRIREGQQFDVPEGARAKWFGPVGELRPGVKPTRTPSVPAPAVGEEAKAPEGGKGLDAMSATELVKFAEAGGLDIGGLVPRNGREKILSAVQAAMVRKPASPSPAVMQDDSTPTGSQSVI